jgi:hypothetical protein
MIVPSADRAKKERQLAKAIDRLQTLAKEDRLCKCEQCKAIKAVLKAWEIR